MADLLKIEIAEDKLELDPEDQQDSEWEDWAKLQASSEEDPFDVSVDIAEKEYKALLTCAKINASMKMKIF